MNATLCDRDAILKTIVLDPDDDIVRLVYADYLDERATTDAERGRAELIRVQVELARMPPAPEPTNGPLTPERRDDWNAHFAWVRAYADQRNHCTERSQELIWLYATEWRNTGPLSERTMYVDRCDWTRTVNWHRGIPVVDVPFGEMGTANWSGAKTGWDFYTPWFAWAVSAVREGCSFRITGRTVSRGIIMWCRLINIDRDYTLPPVIFDELEGYTESDPQRQGQRAAKWYATPELAHRALDRAVLSLVCKEAWEKQS